MNIRLCGCALWLVASCTFEVPVGTSGGTTTPPVTPSLRDPQSADQAAASSPLSAQGSDSDRQAASNPAAPKPASPQPAAPAKPKPNTDSASSMNDPTWPSFGRDLGNTRAVESTRLQGPDFAQRWMQTSAAVTANPVVFDGVAYWGDWDGVFHAVQLADGQSVWRAQPGSRVVSSAFATDALVYVATERGTVHAFDRMSGEQRWMLEESSDPRTRVWSSPVVVGKRLYLGLSRVLDGAPGDRARFMMLGLDAVTGMKEWEFVMDDGLATDAAGQGAGLTLWSTPAVDADRKRLYIAAGRGQGQMRVRFETLLALDSETGQRAFSVPLDDSAPAAPNGDGSEDARTFYPDVAPVLFGGDAGGGGLELVGIHGGTGTYRAHSRDDGRPVWVVQLAGGGQRAAGVIVPAAAYAAGKVFVAVGRFPDQGSLLAIDASTGQRRWSHEFARPVTSALTVAGGAVFAITSEVADAASATAGVGRSGIAQAFDAEDGADVGDFPLPAGAAGGITIADDVLLVGSGFALDSELPVRGGVHARELE